MSLLILLLWASSAPADICAIKLPAIYSNSMIMQRDQVNSIHGYATPRVTVNLSLDGKVFTTFAGLNGQWVIDLPPQTSGGPHKIEIDAAGHVVIENILFGDVWLCSGQSNMAREISITTHTKEDVKNSSNPNIRIFTVTEKKSNVIMKYGEGAWIESAPATVENFSACSYFLARELYEKNKVPVGIVSCCARGLPLNVWFSKQVASSEKNDGPFVTSSVFNAMVAPIIGFGVKGMIWYQGESDIFKSTHYKKMLPKMLSDLRQKWNQPELPIIIVQLPNYAEHDAQPAESLWAEFRDAQVDAAKSIYNSNIMVTSDSAKELPVSLHPLDKRPIAHRLAERVTGMTDYRGTKKFAENPRYASSKAEGQSMIIHFAMHGQSLDSKGKPVKGFAICGQDKKYVWADAEVLPGGADVRVWNSKITKPVAVRYAWADNPVADLYTTGGVPVTPFRTDNFKAKPGDYHLNGRFNFQNDMGLPAKAVTVP